MSRADTPPEEIIDMTRRLSAAHLSAIDLPPAQFIRAASEAGFDAVGLRLLRVTEDTPGYPLMEDRNALRETLAALRDTGLTVPDIEFVRLTPETRIADLAPLLDAGAELGARHVIVAAYDDDRARLVDRLSELQASARERGLHALLEFFPWTPVPDLRTALDVVEQAGPDIGILVDSLHFDRSGSSHELLRRVPRERLPFAHLCDADVRPSYSLEQLLHAARAERLPPGQGEIPLQSFLESLPENIDLAVEVPMTGMAARVGPHEILKHLASLTRSWLATAHGSEPPQTSDARSH
jgi:sugar phosphate isomerase/epimerase